MSDNFMTDLTNEDKELAIANREQLEKNITNLWGHSSKGIEAKKAAMTMLGTKNGMYAKIPLICKAETCPYASTCMLLRYDLAPIGEPCPEETAQVEVRYVQYDKQFELDEASFTDKNLVSELINYDIMLNRLRTLLAKEEVMVVDVVTGVSEQGDVFTHPEVSKTWEAYERVSKKRDNIYDMMLATRKSVKSNKDVDTSNSITQVLSQVMSADDFVIDVRPEDMQ